MQHRVAGVAMLMAVVASGVGRGTARAQELVTDRPDYTESSEVMARGLVQVESGFSYERDGNGTARVSSVTLPAALVRIGVGRRLELRIGADGFESSTDAGTRTSGFSDTELGAKLRILDQDRAGVDLAILPMVSLPTGAADFSSDAIDPTIKITWARSLVRGFDLTGNLNVAWLSDSEGRFAQRALSLSLGHDLLSRWGGFIEAYGFQPMARHQGAGVTIDGGVTRPLGANTQLDLEVGRGITGPASDWFVGFGFAVRRGHAGDRR